MCKFTILLPAWRTEAIRRGISCDNEGNLLSPSATRPAAASAPVQAQRKVKTPTAKMDDTAPANETLDQPSTPKRVATTPTAEGDNPITTLAQGLDDTALCRIATDGKGNWRQNGGFVAFVDEATSRQLTCGTQGDDPAPIVVADDDTAPVPALANNTDTATKQVQSQAGVIDAEANVATATKMNVTPVPEIVKTVPEITILSANSIGPQGTIKGRVIDMAGLAELRVDGRLVPFDSNGGFAVQTYVPDGGITVLVEVVNRLGTTNSLDVRLDRKLAPTATAITFDRLNPLIRKAITNEDALALIIGVETYTETPINAAYANSDARVFADYATQKLGIPENRIRTLVDDSADEKGILLSVQDWLHRASKPGKSDIYIFFAGHGLASEDGEDMYLLPHDGSPRLLDRTALLRKELFRDIAKANPRSVTAFLDTCYSGTTRGTGTLIASRPIAIRAREQAIPDGFTVMTAAAGDQTAKPLEEVKHGMFSYFLMKGMEGDADANRDNQITAGELHAYVQQNVIQQSSGSQTPELQGDVDRVLVRFQ
ncbi:MAG: caspase family protein [Alphaproteobacteria bacterium]